MIYFIREGSEDRAIKIGKADDPIARLRSLQTAHHRELELLAVADGSTDEEEQEHRRWAKLRIRGEWFKADPDLLRYIEDVNWVPGDCDECGEEAMFELIQENAIQVGGHLCEKCFARETETDTPCEFLDGECVHCGKPK